MTFHGYDITGTLLWLCSRPECLVLYRLQGNDDGPLKPITLEQHMKLVPLIAGYYEVRCFACKRRLSDKEGL